MRITSKTVFALFFLLSCFSCLICFGEGSDFSNLGEKKISDEESRHYRELFQLYSDLELMTRLRQRQEEEIRVLERSIRQTRVRLDEYRRRIAANLKDYAEILRLRQQNGEVSYLKLILESENLSEFLDRINLASTISGGYRRIADSLDADLAAEEELKLRLDADREEKKRKNEKLNRQIEENITRSRKLEAYLNEKGGDRARYEKELKFLSDRWRELRPLFNRTVNHFVQLIEQGGLPNDVMEVAVSLAGVRGRVRDDVFNALLSEAFQDIKDAVEIRFKASDGGVYVYIPSHEVVLFGDFDVTPYSLKYRVRRGSFYGIEMGDSAVEDLFMGGELVIKIANLLEMMKMELQDCKVEDGYIEFGIRLKF